MPLIAELHDCDIRDVVRVGAGRNRDDFTNGNYDGGPGTPFEGQ